MKQVVYADEAINDLARLRKFVTVHNPIAASKIAADLITRITLLADFPDIGRPVIQAPNPASIRDMIFDKYVVRYSVHPDTIIVLRVWHGLENKK